ncbi:MAG: NAD-dependent epimerase/dehydratase family protein [Pseudomonadales bacterium]
MKLAVVGASGIVGRAVVTQAQMQGIEVVALSRNAPDIAHCEFVPVDLLDEQTCREQSPHLSDVTHVVYTALFEKPGLLGGWRESDQMQTNLTMLQNCLEHLLAQAELAHVALLQGTKAYGAHLGPMKIPGKESEPRVVHDNFYWLQEDYLTGRAAEHSFAYSIWRPQVIIGHGFAGGQGAPMNMLAAIGAYIAFCLYDGKPCGYPGGPNSPMEVVDAELLGRAILFGLESAKASNQIFNVTNGDVMEWANLWPAFTRVFGLPEAPPEPMALTQLYAREDDWQKLCEQFELERCTLKEFVGDSFYYADALFATGADRPPPPALVSTIKLRQAGFHECLDSEVMFSRWLQKLQMMNRLPQRAH